MSNNYSNSRLYPDQPDVQQQAGLTQQAGQQWQNTLTQREAERPPLATLLNSVEIVMRKNSSDVHALTQALKSIADRLVGSRPQAMEDNHYVSVRKLEEQNKATTASILMLAQQIDQIERL